MAFVNRLNDTATQIVGARGSAVETARGRLVFMSVLFVLAFVGVGVRVSFLSLVPQGAEPRYDTLKVASDTATTLAAGRADVVDRNGVLLARTLETISVYADPKMIAQPAQVAADLAGVFEGLEQKDLEERLASKRRFVWIMRGITPQQMAQVNALGHPGLDFRRESRRFYPQENLTAHILGYTGVDGDGLAGVERAFNGRLKRRPAPLKLTLDVRFQYALWRAMAKAMAEFKAKGAAGAIMDVNTGELLAAVSLPDFNPQNVGDASPEQRFNRFALGVYEMGSTFKTFSTAALLDKVSGALGQKFDATKPLRRAGFTIRDFHAEKRVMSVPEIFMHSSNIGTALMSEKIGTQRLRSFYEELGFDKPVPLNISEHAAPLLPKPWRDISTLTVSYGHGISVTPLHLIRAFAGIVNGGVLPAMHIEYGEKDKVRPRLVSEETSRKMRDLLRLVVTHGTAEKADVPGAMVGGKTGTSEKNINGRYVHHKLVSSLVAMFPADKPRYAILVSVDEPVGNKQTWGYATAGWVAAPAVQDVVKNIMNLDNMPKADAAHDAAIEAEMVRYIPLPSKAGQAHLVAYER